MLEATPISGPIRRRKKPQVFLGNGNFHAMACRKAGSNGENRHTAAQKNEDTGPRNAIMDAWPFAYGGGLRHSLLRGGLSAPCRPDTFHGTAVPGATATKGMRLVSRMNISRAIPIRSDSARIPAALSDGSWFDRNQSPASYPSGAWREPDAGQAAAGGLVCWSGPHARLEGETVLPFRLNRQEDTQPACSSVEGPTAAWSPPW